MSLTALHPPVARDQWRAETEEVLRGHLVDVINISLRNPNRTWPEQQALLELIDTIDGPTCLREVALLRTMAEESWVRSHLCECGKVSARYWCSDACQIREDGPYGDPDDAA